ncbi:MAG: hypothetical protein PF541_15600, partial [Prolixibacteraceae bacterium]|nr:hypothetical protein [Prolixibacteraceae bacterium]
LLLPELIKSYNASKLFCIGNSKTVFESLQYTKCHTKLESKIVLNTIENSDGNLQGLYTVTINPKTKFILVDGHNYSSIYRSAEQFLQKFQVKENYKSTQENISENIVHHK